MKVSLNWLREFLPLDQTPAEIADLLTFAGVEVEGIEQKGVNAEKVIVAKILSSEPHPNADRLSVCQVDDGSGLPRQIVCGAKNYLVGDKIPLALPGAILPGDFKIKVGKLRGVDSEGMMCSAKELGISEESAGLLILNPEAAIGENIQTLFPADTIFDLEITPNRADLLSHAGIARELGAILSVPLKTPETAPEIPTGGGLPVRIASSACSFYSGRIIRGVKIGPSPDWLVRRLQSVGLRSINNVVDVTNFVMLEMGQPLHAFDLAKIDRGIVVRDAQEGEKFLALDQREYSLASTDMIIGDESRALAIGGVMGGLESGVSNQTTDIFLESALFASGNIRRTSRVLGLGSDASYRYERGVDPGKILSASARACQLLHETAGGVADPILSLAGELPALEWTIELRAERCRQLLGTPVSDSRIEEILSGLGLKKSGASAWIIPSFRADLTREIDLIEEVARVFGIQNVPSQLGGFAVPISTIDRIYDFQISLKRHLAARGFSEARTLSLRPAMETAFRTETALKVRNPLTEDQVFFRQNLLNGLLKVAEYNQRMGAGTIRLMELGRVFQTGKTEEKSVLGLLMTGETGTLDWRSKPDPLDFFKLKAEVTALVKTKFVFEKVEMSGMAFSAVIVLAGEQIGWLGQLLPALGRDAGLKSPVFAAEIDLGKLHQLLPPLPHFAPLPKFPAMARDIAMLAPETLGHAEIEAALLSANEPLLQKLTLFDIFSDPTGEKIPADKKSLAYSLTYRAEDRTLLQDEVNAAHARLKARLVENCGVTLRE